MAWGQVCILADNPQASSEVQRAQIATALIQTHRGRPVSGAPVVVGSAYIVGTNAKGYGIAFVWDEAKIGGLWPAFGDLPIDLAHDILCEAKSRGMAKVFVYGATCSFWPGLPGLAFRQPKVETLTNVLEDIAGGADVGRASELLAGGAKVTPTALTSAVFANRPDMVELLLSHVDFPLHWALLHAPTLVDCGCWNSLPLLVKRGLPVDGLAPEHRNRLAEDPECMAAMF